MLHLNRDNIAHAILSDDHYKLDGISGVMVWGGHPITGRFSVTGRDAIMFISEDSQLYEVGHVLNNNGVAHMFERFNTLN